MRYIYKAKDLNNNWVFGAYFKFLPYTPAPIKECYPPESEYKHLIIKEGFSDWNLPRDLKAVEINPETLCQCTGMKDEKGEDIFENDIVIVSDYQKEDSNSLENYFIKWNKKFIVDGFHVDLAEINDKLEVIGNKFD